MSPPNQRPTDTFLLDAPDYIIHSARAAQHRQRSVVAMPLNDITFRGNISPTAALPCAKGVNGAGGQLLEASRNNAVGTGDYDSSWQKHAAKVRIVIDTVFLEGSELSPAVQSLPAGERPLDSASNAATTGATSNSRPSSGIDGVKESDRSCDGDWETTLLCYPIRTSIDYLQPSEWDDKRSICSLCRGVSVQAGSEVRHCRGRTHRTAYALLQTLRFMDPRERNYIEQHTIEKNGQDVTAWRCVLCDTKSLSHEYMNKHLLGKKHRLVANQELELVEWNTGYPTAVGFVDFQTSQQPIFQAIPHQDVADENKPCFLCRNHQFHQQCTYENTFNSTIHDESGTSQEFAPNSIDPFVNPNDIVRFLGLLSPEKPITNLRQAGGERQNYDAVLRDISFLPPRLSPFNAFLDDATETPRSAYDFVNECLSYETEATCDRLPLPALQNGWRSEPLDDTKKAEASGFYSLF